MARFAEIEEAIKTALSTVLTYCPTVETYAGQLEDIVAGNPVRFPFCGVFFSGEDYEHAGGPTWGVTAQYTVIIGVRGHRGQEALRRGALAPIPVPPPDPPEPQATLLHGAYEIIEDVKTALVNNDLALDIEPLVPLRCENVLSTADAVAYALTFETMFDESFPQA